MKAFLATLFSVGVALAPRGADTPPPPGYFLGPELVTTVPRALGQMVVSKETCPVIGGQTNPAVTARWVGPAGPPGYEQLVLFSKDTQEVLLGSANPRHHCLLNGRLFRVDAARRDVYVTPSTPLGTNLFTAQSALEFGKRAFVVEPGDHGPYALQDSPEGHSPQHSGFATQPDAFLKRALAGRGVGGRGVLVDLCPLVPDQNVRPGATNACVIADVAIKPLGTNLQVSFEFHYTRGGPGIVLNGTVLLDQKLNVLSKALTEPLK